MFYIQRKDTHTLETVDEFETIKEAKLMVIEYITSDSTAIYYLSTRACNNWGKA